MRTPPAATASLPASPDDIDLTAIGRAVQAHIGKIGIAACVAGAIAGGICFVLPQKFTAQAQIEIISKGVGNPFETRRDGGATPDNLMVRMDKEAIGTHVRSLMSTDLALKVAEQMRLGELPEFNNAVGTPSLTRRLMGSIVANPRETDEDRVLKSYFEALRVYQLKDTRGITIEFTSLDPKLSAEGANRVAELYRDALFTRAVTESNDARAKLGPQIMKLAQEVAQAEAEVTQFRGRSNLFEAGREKTGLNEQQLTELTADLTRTAALRTEAEARAKEAREIARRGGAESLADVQKSQLIPRLIEQRVRLERQISELSATLLAAHPRMKQLNADLDGLNVQIDSEVDKIVLGLEREAKVMQLREDGIRKRLEDAKKRVVESGADDVKLRALESVVKSKRAEFERLQAQVEAARTTGDAVAVPVEVQIISRARTPSEKSSPRTGMIIAMAAVATFLFGLAVVVLHAMFTSARAGTARSTSVGTWTPSGARSAAASSWIAPKAPPPAEVRSIAGIARYLVEKAERRSGFRTIVTPETAHIALGEFPADLARHLAILKRQVILIEWSPEGISLPGNVPTLGLADVLAGNASFEDVIAPLMGSNAHVISAGTGIATPSGSVERDRINMLLDALDEVYDHIVITGAYPVMRELFTTVEGCIDAGVVLATPHSTPALGDFLGYSVPDLDVIRFEQEAGDVDGEGFGSIRPGHRPSGPSLSASA